MCGIAGAFGPKAELAIVNDMVRAIAHRGPDETARAVRHGHYVGAACRLAVTEREGGSQPATDTAETMFLSFNGEIYNYRELARGLLAGGARLADRSECAMLVALYAVHGTNMFALLEGMFAIALYDIPLDRLILARDHRGIKPLYYSEQDHMVLYGSEIKALFAARTFRPAVDEGYSAYRAVFDFGPSDRTLFKGVVPVRPGTWLSFSVDAMAVSGNFPSNVREAIHQEADPKALIRDLVNQAISRQMPRDMTAAVFLSGGLDSSIVARCALDVDPARVRLCTIADRSETGDLAAARTVSQAFGTPLTECKAPNASMHLLLHYLAAREEFDLLSLAWFGLASDVARLTRVALSGQGADELFCGYPFHRDVRATVTEFRRRWTAIKHRAHGPIVEVIEQQLHSLSASDLHDEFYKLFMNEQLAWFQLEPLDKCSMAHGLEVRVPFLDDPLTSLISVLPRDLIYAGEKDLLRGAFKNDGIPTISRPKQFAGRWTIPDLHADMVGLCCAWVGEEPLTGYESNPMVASRSEAACLETLMILMEDFSGAPVSFEDAGEISRLAASRIGSPSP